MPCLKLDRWILDSRRVKQCYSEAIKFFELTSSTASYAHASCSATKRTLRAHWKHWGRFGEHWPSLRAFWQWYWQHVWCCKALHIAEQQHRAALLDRRSQQIQASPPVLVSVRHEITRPYASGFPNFSSSEEPLVLCLSSIHWYCACVAGEWHISAANCSRSLMVSWP